MSAGVIAFELDRGKVKALRELAKTGNCSFFMVMLALFNVLLFKLTGREDILVSTFIAGRRGPELQKMVGMLVNTLLLRNYPTGEKQFKVFLNEVKQQTLNAYENQDYPLGCLLKRMSPNGERPLPVDVNFVLQDMDPSGSLIG
jgi:tyrocidine synthetase-3